MTVDVSVRVVLPVGEKEAVREMVGVRETVQETVEVVEGVALHEEDVLIAPEGTHRARRRRGSMRANGARSLPRRMHPSISQHSNQDANSATETGEEGKGPDMSALLRVDEAKRRPFPGMPAEGQHLMTPIAPSWVCGGARAAAQPGEARPATVECGGAGCHHTYRRLPRQADDILQLKSKRSARGRRRRAPEVDGSASVEVPPRLLQNRYADTAGPSLQRLHRSWLDLI